MARDPDPGVDYGRIDVDDPRVQLILAQDHRAGVHHYGLACCEPWRAGRDKEGR